MIEGKGLDSYESDEVSDKLLEDIWAQVKLLHSHHSSHRDLRTANVFVDKQNQPWIIDFVFAESMASDRSISKDIANLLASMATLVGPQRAVASCSKVMGNKTLVAAYPFLQYDVFSGATRADLKKDKTQLPKLKEEIAKTVGKQKVEGKHEKVKRISTASLVQIIALTIALFVLAPQFSTFRDSFGTLVSVNAWWLLVIFPLVVLTYLAAAFTLKTFSIYPMKQIDSTMVQLAASFTNRLLPSGVGGLALNIQFLRTRGHKVSEATSVLLMQRTMDFIGFIVPLFFILILSRDELADQMNYEFNIGRTIIILLVIAAVIAVLASIKKIRSKVVEFVNKMISTLVKLATDPIVLSKGFLSSLLMNMAFLSALFFSLRAVGLDISFVESTIVFAGAAAASSVAPTPGGLGVVEAAMVASLVALGYSGDTALAGVLLYRLFTYWLPIPFGWLSYRYIINKKLI
jgi:undecaprenyl-diphosphatase